MNCWIGSRQIRQCHSEPCTHARDNCKPCPTCVLARPSRERERTRQVQRVQSPGPPGGGDGTAADSGPRPLAGSALTPPAPIPAARRPALLRLGAVADPGRAPPPAPALSPQPRCCRPRSRAAQARRRRADADRAVPPAPPGAVTAPRSAACRRRFRPRRRPALSPQPRTGADSGRAPADADTAPDAGPGRARPGAVTATDAVSASGPRRQPIPAARRPAGRADAATAPDADRAPPGTAAAHRHRAR